MKPTINVTPLIDVLLVLLIIFMIITPSKPSRFETQIPSEKPLNNVLVQNPLTLLVTINPDKTLHLNLETGKGTVENPELLVSKLKEVLKSREEQGIFRVGTNEIEKTVFIKAPKSIDYGSVVKIVDATKSAGANPIGLQVDELQ